MSKRYSAIAHQARRTAAPISEASLERIIRQVAWTSSCKPNILEIGCGKGEFLLALIKQTEGRGLGVDISVEAIASAQSRRDELAVKAEFQECSATELSIQDNSFQIAVCVGSSHALGGIDSSLRTLARAVEPTGLVLVADLFWKREPEPRHLAEMGMSLSDLDPSYADLIGRGSAHNLQPVFCQVSTQQEWDDYEWSLIGSVDRHLYKNPDDPEAEQLRKHLEFMRSSYLKWRRDSMGFVTVLYRKVA